MTAIVHWLIAILASVGIVALATGLLVYARIHEDS